MIGYVSGTLILLGGFFAIIAALGMLRLPDVLIRMHASTKIGTLSSGLIMAAVAMEKAEPGIVVRCVVIIVFMLMTAPIGAHMIGRAAIRTGVPLWSPEKKDHHLDADTFKHETPANAAPSSPKAE